MVEILLFGVALASGGALALALMAHRAAARALDEAQEALQDVRQHRWKLHDMIAEQARDMADLASTVGLRRAQPAERQSAWERKL